MIPVQTNTPTHNTTTANHPAVISTNTTARGASLAASALAHAAHDFVDRDYDLNSIKETFNGIVHQDVFCDKCTMRPLRGLRFKCTQCEGVDLCIECFISEYSNVGKHSPDHKMMVIANSSGNQVNECIGYAKSVDVRPAPDNIPISQLINQTPKTVPTAYPSEYQSTYKPTTNFCCPNHKTPALPPPPPPPTKPTYVEPPQPPKHSHNFCCDYINKSPSMPPPKYDVPKYEVPKYEPPKQNHSYNFCCDYINKSSSSSHTTHTTTTYPNPKPPTVKPIAPPPPILKPTNPPMIKPPTVPKKKSKCCCLCPRARLGTPHRLTYPTSNTTYNTWDSLKVKQK